MPAAVDPPCTCRFINGTTRHRGILSVLSPRNSPGALLRALFSVILRQSPRRGCSRTIMYAPPPDGGFSLSDAEISPSVPRALFGELLCQAVRHKCVPTHPPYEERIGTKGDGAERGTHLNGVWVRKCSKNEKNSFFDISAPSPLSRNSHIRFVRQQANSPPRFRRGKVRRTGSADSVEAKARGGSVGAEGAVVAGAVAGGGDLEEGGGVGECPEEDEDGGEGGGVVRDLLRVCGQRGDVEVCARVPCAGFETRKLLKE